MTSKEKHNSIKGGVFFMEGELDIHQFATEAATKSESFSSPDDVSRQIAEFLALAIDRPLTEEETETLSLLFSHLFNQNNSD